MLQHFFSDFIKYFRYALRSASASLKAEVAGSYLNWIWWVLNPLCFMMIYAFIFGVVFDAREEHFGLFIFIGLSMWEFFNSTMQHSVKIIKNNKAIVTKLYIPKFVLVLADMMVNAFKMGISFIIVAIMMVINRVPLSWSILWAIPIILVHFVVTFGFALILMHLGVVIQDMPNIVSIVLRLLFYFTGVFYDIEKRVPAPLNTLAVRVNPLGCLITQMRRALLNGQAIMVDYLLIWLAVGTLVTAFDVYLIYKNENSYVKVI